MSESQAPERLISAAERTRSFMVEADLEGWDPYDGLLSPLFRLPVLRDRWSPRYVAQQAVMRVPLNLRPLLRVPPQLNPVSIGLYVQGLADLAAADLVDRDAASAEISSRVAKLSELSASGCSGSCWGYPFPWEGRRHRMPAGHPTVVVTGIVVNGLHRVWRVLGDEEARRLVVSSAGFVLADLRRAAGDDEAYCWSYSPSDDQAVLNATMKGARLLAQAIDAGFEDDGTAAAAARASVRFVIAHQSADGGWPYAVGGDPRTWRDSYHTGYVLECLDTYRRLLGDDEFDGAIVRGWVHYRSTFFRDDALPRYYDRKDGPIDPTAAGQALFTLVAFGDTEFARDVAVASLAALARSDGSFAYRCRRGRPVGPRFMRWSTAWMFAGMARLLAASAPLDAGERRLPAEDG